MSNDRELKPCPFCGGEAKIVSYQCAEDAMCGHAECTKCEARSGSYEDAYTPLAEITMSWNDRTKPSPNDNTGDRYNIKAAADQFVSSQNDNTGLIEELGFVVQELDKRRRGFAMAGDHVMAENYARYTGRVRKAITALKQDVEPRKDEPMSPVEKLARTISPMGWEWFDKGLEKMPFHAEESWLHSLKEASSRIPDPNAKPHNPPIKG